MKFDPKTVAIVLLLIAGLLGTKKSNPTPSPKPDDWPTPSIELQKAVEKVKAFRGKKNADAVAWYYHDLAWAVNRDKDVIKTTSQFRSLHQRSQVMFAEGTDIAGSLPGLSVEIDIVLMQQLGKDDVTLNRSKTVEVLDAIAWALQG